MHSQSYLRDVSHFLTGWTHNLNSFRMRRARNIFFFFLRTNSFSLFPFYPICFFSFFSCFFFIFFFIFLFFTLFLLFNKLSLFISNITVGSSVEGWLASFLSFGGSFYKYPCLSIRLSVERMYIADSAEIWQHSENKSC